MMRKVKYENLSFTDEICNHCYEWTFDLSDEAWNAVKLAFKQGTTTIVDDALTLHVRVSPPLSL